MGLRETKEHALLDDAKVSAPGASGAPTVRIDEGGPAIVEELGNEWRELCESGPSNEPFYRPEWIAAYLRTLIPPHRLLLATVRAGGKLTAALPLIEARVIFSGVPMRKLLAPCDEDLRFDVVRSPGTDGDGAVLALWQFLKGYPGWDMLEFPDVPEGAALEHLLRAAEADGFPVGARTSMNTPYISLTGWDGTPDFWLVRRNRRFRATVRSTRRKLVAQGPLALRRYEHADPELLRRFYDLEQAGWKGRKGSAIASDAARQAFHSEVARGAERYGYFTLYFLEHNGTTIAADFGFTYGGRYLGVKGAINERYKRYGPGHLLVDAVLRDCCERGLREYDFIGQSEEWKRRWTSQVRPHAYLCVFQKGLHGRLAHFAKFRVNPHIKKILHLHHNAPR
jgi:CelD/BcsL family acetyltransferase involved in cellulose biosynthesis